MSMLAEMTLHIAPLWPAWLIWAAVVVLLATLTWGTVLLGRKGIDPRWITVLTLLRLGIVALFVLVVLQPLIGYSGLVEKAPELIVLVDTSQSMAIPSGPGSRLEEVLAAARDGELGAALSERFQVQWYGFDASARPLDRNRLQTLKAEGAVTNLADSVVAAAYQEQAAGRKPERLLLLSDGNDRGSADPVEAARRFGLTVDVLAPTAARNDAPATVEIADVQATRRVLLGSETHFRVTIVRDTRAANDQSARLHLYEDGKQLLERPVTLKAGSTEEAVVVPHRPDAAGLKQYEFRLLAEGNGQQHLGKPFSLPVQVVGSKYEVLILEDSWRWEYKYLHRLLEDDPSFRFTALLSRGSKSYVQFAAPDRRVNLIGFPQGRQELEDFDIFFLGDIVPSRWPRGLGQALAQLVTDEGRSLVVVAGPGVSNLLDVPELHALLPVDVTSGSGRPVEGPLDVRLHPGAGASSFFFQLRREEQSLPPLDRVYPVLRQRPGATVLLEAARQRNDYGNLIVLAEHTVGRGRVLFVATDTLWKWHTLAPGEGPSPYSIFWQQAFRALTPSRSRVAAVNLWLTPGRTRGQAGRALTLHAEVDSARPLPAADLQAAVTLPDERRVSLVFAADPTNPLRYRSTFTPLVPGPHRISATLLSEGKVAAEVASALQVDEPASEQRDRGIDRATLTRLAQASGGQLIDPQRPDTWPRPASTAAALVSRTRLFDPWNNFTLLLALCALLGADWFIRLFKGLV